MSMEYAAKQNAAVAFIEVQFNHSTRASFATLIVDIYGNVKQFGGHPKRNGVTKKNGWAVDPELLHAQW